MAFVDNSKWTLEWVALEDMIVSDLAHYKRSISNKKNWDEHCKLYSSKHAIIQVCRQDGQPVSFMTLFIQNTRNNKDYKNPHILIYDFHTIMKNMHLEEKYKVLKVQEIDKEMIQNAEFFTNNNFTGYDIICHKNVKG